MANKLFKALDRQEWEITIVDQHKTHYYQPGFLFIPFGIYNKSDVVKPKGDFFPSGVKVIYQEIDRIEGEENRVHLSDGTCLKYDFLIIATGTHRNRLGAKGEKALVGRGVSYCVDCDGNFYRGQAVAVVGGESAAVDGAFDILSCSSVT